MTDPESDITETLKIGQAPGRGMIRRFWYIPIVLALGVLAALIFTRTGAKSEAARYLTEVARRGDLTVIVTATGTLEPTNTVEVGSELSGIIRTVTVDYNDQVKVDQVLAELDTSKLEAQVTQSKASLEAAEAKVVQAQATVKETGSVLDQYQRVWEASGGKVPSRTAYDAAEAAFARAEADEASARAEVARARATLEANKTDLAKSVIRSPINGIVLTRSVEPGQTVAASFQAPVLFTLAEDLTKMELCVDVDEADIGKVEEGQEAEFTVAAYPNRAFTARITQARYGSSTTSGVVTYETVLQVENPDLSLRPGMTATADITVKKVEAAVLVPTAALRFTPPIREEKKPSGSLVGSLLPRPPRQENHNHQENSGTREQQVWTLRDGQLTPIPVTIGPTDGSWTEIVSGQIEAGTTVVVDTNDAGR